MTKLRLYVRTLIALVWTGILSGCVAVIPDRIHYQWDADTARPASSDADRDVHVSVAFSGGGSRAALFAAAGAEALHRHGLLADVTHVSTVSGGSMAGAYLTTQALADCVPGAPCADAYFEQFKTAMRANYFWPMERRQFAKPNRWFSPTRRISSLQESFDATFLAEKTFGDVVEGRVLMVNAASYDDSRMFVFANEAGPALSGGAERFAVGSPYGRRFERGDCISSVPADFPIALAVAASAAVPPALGPVSIEALPGCGQPGTEYWHLGDGGILDNSGVETLDRVIQDRASAGTPPRAAVIFSFDAGRGTDVAANMAAKNPRLWTRDPARVVDISMDRGNWLRRAYWQDIRKDYPFPVDVIDIQYMAATGLAWPASCGQRQRRADDIAGHLRRVPTKLSITDCDADLVEAAAHRAVEQAVSDHADVLGVIRQ